MKIRIVFLVFLVQIMFISFGYGQSGFMRPGSTPTVQEPQSVPVSSDNPDWSLPPLQVLIDHAIENSRMLKMADNEILMSEYSYTDIRREWLRRINLTTFLSYGSMFDLSRLSGTTTGVPYINSSALMLNYGVGMMVGTPLSDLFDRKRTKQRSKLIIEQAKMTKEESINSLTQTVIQSYYNVLSIQKTLALSNEMFLMAGLVHDRAKLDLAQNKISFGEYTRANQTFLNAQNTVELQKYSLMVAVKSLEIIVGIELLKTK